MPLMFNFGSHWQNVCVSFQVRYSEEPIMKAFFKMFFIFDSQMWIPDDTKIHVFKNNKPETEIPSSNGVHKKHN